MFGDAQAEAMSDDDGDGIWSITLSVDSGLAGNYIFLNSPNNGWDWGTKENLRDSHVLIRAITMTAFWLLSPVIL